MPSRLARPVAIALGALLAACTDAGPTAPTMHPPPSAPATARDATAPGLPGGVYVGRGVYDASAEYHGGWLGSQYVLYADSTFALQFSSGRWGYFAYTGRYTVADSLVEFDWDGWSIAGPWEATGVLRGDTLRVRYNDIMLMTDFVDGTYVLAPDAPWIGRP